MMRSRFNQPASWQSGDLLGAPDIVRRERHGAAGITHLEPLQAGWRQLFGRARAVGEMHGDLPWHCVCLDAYIVFRARPVVSSGIAYGLDHTAWITTIGGVPGMTVGSER